MIGESKAMIKSTTDHTNKIMNAYRSVLACYIISTVLALASCSGEADPLPEMYTMQQVTINGGIFILSMRGDDA